jgi:2-polyprenyl-6-methoxyphenol hydroxylase-like FAD-dependent oxidoreductase
MLPHHGQGANQTIEDAAVLAGELASVFGGAGGLDAALCRYSRRAGLSRLIANSGGGRKIRLSRCGRQRP